MSEIKQATNGSLAKNKKLNEVIRAVNSIAQMEVTEGSEGQAPTFVFGANRSSLIVPASNVAQDGEGNEIIYGTYTVLVCNTESGIAEQVTFLTQI